MKILRASCISGPLSGNTALHLAAGNGHLDTVMALVDYGGADVKAEGDWGYSALHFYAR